MRDLLELKKRLKSKIESLKVCKKITYTKRKKHGLELNTVTTAMYTLIMSMDATRVELKEKKKELKTKMKDLRKNVKSLSAKIKELDKSRISNNKDIGKLNLRCADLHKKQFALSMD